MEKFTKDKPYGLKSLVYSMYSVPTYTSHASISTVQTTRSPSHNTEYTPEPYETTDSIYSTEDFEYATSYTSYSDMNTSSNP